MLTQAGVNNMGRHNRIKTICTVLPSNNNPCGTERVYQNLYQIKVFGLWFTKDREYVPYAVIRDLREKGHSKAKWQSKFKNCAFFSLTH